MADNQRVLFGAEFDVSQVVENARQVTDVFRGLQGTQKTLSEASTAYKLTLKQVSDQITQTESSIRSLDKSSKTYDKDLTDLNKDLKEMKNQQSATVKSLEDNDKLLQATTKTLDGYTKGTRDATKAVSDLGKEHVTAREHVGYLHKELDEVFNRQVRTAIRGVGEALIGGFIGVIIGQALPSMDKLIEKFQEWLRFEGEFEKHQKMLSEVAEDAAKQSGNQIAKLELLKNKLNDLSIPENERIKVATEYNKIADKQNEIDLKQIDNLKEINKNIDAQINLVKERALAYAATKNLGEIADKFLEAQFKVTEKARVLGFNDENKPGLREKDFTDLVENILAIRQKAIDKMSEKVKNPLTAMFGDLQGQTVKADNLLKQLGIDPDKDIEIFKNLTKYREEFDKATDFYSKFIKTAGLTTDDHHTDKKGPDNYFDRLLAELKARWETTSEKMATTITAEGITKKFQATLDKEYQKMNDYVKGKHLSPQQAGVLKNILKDINDMETTTEIKEFDKKHQAMLDKLDGIIAENNDKHAANRIAAIRNEFDREKANIENTYTTTVQSLANSLEKLKTETLNDRTLTQPEKDQKITILGNIFAQLMGDADQTRIHQQMELAFKIFQDGIKDLQKRLSETDVNIKEGFGFDITKLSHEFLAGKITYQNYEKELTKILVEEKKKRDQARLDELKQERVLLEAQIARTTDPTIRAKLQVALIAVRSAIADLSTEMAEAEVNSTQKAAAKRLQVFLAYVKEVQSILSIAANFWQQVNEVEQKSIERSLALQEVRVSRAQRIADKGNAEYLEMELKRQDELLRKKDEAARKELAINQALTLSNATVAAISAIAKASEEGGFLSIAAATAATIGAIAAAFAFVNSLKPVVPSFFAGVEQVTGNGAPAGKDKVPANLHVGERVMTAPDNRNYWDVLHAVHTHQVPPQVLNTFVKNYNKFPGHKAHEVPIVNYSRLEQATNGKMGYDNAELLNKVDRLNDTMGSVVKGLHSLGLNVSLDERGLTASIEKVRKGETLRKKS